MTVIASRLNSGKGFGLSPSAVDCTNHTIHPVGNCETGTAALEPQRRAA